MRERKKTIFMENSLNEKESLDLISQMINTAKNNLQKGTAKIILLWGYLVAGISLATWVLLETLPFETRYHAFYLWFLMVAGYPFHFMLVKKIEREKLVRTYIEGLMNRVWIGFTISILMVVFGMLIDSLIVNTFAEAVKPGHEFIRWFHWLLLVPFMLCLYGFALFVSGKAYEFKPLTYGGIFCFAACFVLLFSLHKTGVYGIQQFTLFISAVVGFVIPGHLLNRKEKNDVQGS